MFTRRTSGSAQPRRRGALAALASLALAAGGIVTATPAFAASVYEIDGRWTPDTPDVVASGEVVTAEWRVNVNDDRPAPSNDPVDNVNFTVDLTHGRFTTVPDACLTSGVDPVSSILNDGASLLCNLGTHDQGTAVVVQAPFLSDGATGDQISALGTIEGATSEVDPITIENPFRMDIAWENSVTGVTQADGGMNASLQWTLFLGAGSEPGPDEITYTLDVSASGGRAVTLAPALCTAFTTGTAGGHPWSGGDHPADQIAPFVDSCELTATGTPGQFQLHLSGIDYSLAQVPTRHSGGGALPADRSAIASGSVNFHVAGTADGSISLESDAPTYESPSGLTSTDDPANNASNKNWVTGSWSSAWQPEGTGYQTSSWWSDEFKVAPGARIQSLTNVSHGQGVHPADSQYGQCLVLDTRYVVYESAVHRHGWAGAPVDSTMQWYTGAAATLDPASASYDPNAFRCANDPSGWTTTEPADPTTIKAVRVLYPFSAIQGDAVSPLQVVQTVKPDTAIGQDIWMFGEAMIEGQWQPVNRSMDPADAGEAWQTPGARYPFLPNGRDVVRIVGADPAVEKSVDRAAIRPGDEPTYTLTYSANGPDGVAETVDGYVLTDTLPVGMTYVPGSADPEPEVTTEDGVQTLTWTLDGVPTNQRIALTYRAVADDSVEPGSRLVNTAVASLGGSKSAPVTATVTVSTNGYTTIGKTADTPYLPNEEGDGVGEGSWTVTLRSFDPLPQDFTDTIDILPYLGDERGTSFSGSYELTAVDAAAGATVYYTDASPETLSDDPGDASNGAAGDITGNTVGWSTDFDADATAVRVIGGELAPGAVQQFQVHIVSDGVHGEDVLVNRAQARDAHTELVMRTSSQITVANYYSAALKKYVQDSDGEWHDANTVEDYPTFHVGDTIRYRVTVQNTGQGTLTGIEVSDDQQPEPGAFEIDELAPGESESHEYEIVADADMEGGLVNTACAAADVPEDSGTAPEINCDPAGVDVDGEPTHTKSLISAEPIGGGQWQVVYGLEVTNASAVSTEYSLFDTLHFSEQIGIDSAEVTVAPDGVTLADPAWDGQGELLIASDVALPGNDDADYAPHEYEVTVIADVPLQFTGDDIAAETGCPADGEGDSGFNNASEMTNAQGESEFDQACAVVPSLRIEKTLDGEPQEGANDRWTVAYDITVTNDGSGDGVYDLTDELRYGAGIEVISASVTDAPDGVTPSSTWTGLGVGDAAENVVATDVALAAGAAHDYHVVVVAEADADTLPVSAKQCADDGSRGGFANTAGIVHNDLTAYDDACAPPPPPLAQTGGGIALGALGAGVVALIVGGLLLGMRRRTSTV